MSGFTPGPWLAMRGTESTGRQVADWAVSVDDGSTWICTGPTWDSEFQSESFSNARLIAAAPELLTELKWLTELFEASGMYDDEVFDRARAAIAKAAQP